MIKQRINIGIIESSVIIQEGIENLLLKGSPEIHTIHVQDIEDLNLNMHNKKLDYIIMSPAQILNRIKLFKNLKSENPDFKWFALVYSIFDKDILLLFDEVISLDDTRESIFRKIQKYKGKSESSHSGANLSDPLSEREIEVLKEVVRGRSNRDIGKVLNISIHTVMSHRKNISQKTGIKSQAGLTIYALTNNVISIEQI